MAANAVVRARVDQHLKDEASAILGAAGLTVSDAFRMLLTRTVAERGLPFSAFSPSRETVEALKASRRGDLETIGGVEDLMSDLHADD